MKSHYYSGSAYLCSYTLNNLPNSLFLESQRGSQKICLESPGQHELHFVNSCIFFGSMSVKFDTLEALVYIYIFFLPLGFFGP